MTAELLHPVPPSRVLIVDDEDRLREVLRRAVESWGFHVTEARSGEEAIRITRSAPCDIHIVDLNLPLMDGIELLGRLRELRPGSPAIILTGFGDLAAAQAAIRLEVVDFLEKPCPLGDLEKALHRAAQRLAPPSPIVELPPSQQPSVQDAATLEELERRHIVAALQRNDGNRTAAARELGISRRTLQYKITDYQRQGYVVD